MPDFIFRADTGHDVRHITQPLLYLPGYFQDVGIFVLELWRSASSKINSDRARRGSYLPEEAQIHLRDVFCSSEGSQIESMYAGVFSQISLPYEVHCHARTRRAPDLLV